jgi:hypothetical protein
MSKTKRAPTGELPVSYHKIPLFYLGVQFFGLESLLRENVSEYSISPVQVQARAYKEGYGRGIEGSG